LKTSSRCHSNPPIARASAAPPPPDPDPRAVTGQGGDDGSIANVGPCWFFPAATGVVFDLAAWYDSTGGTVHQHADANGATLRPSPLSLISMFALLVLWDIDHTLAENRG
jgi:hypothetical protein